MAEPTAKLRDVSRMLVSGAIAGTVATLPMSWAMEVMHRLLPAGERDPLPPRQITERMSETVGLHDRLSDEQRLWLSLVAHLGYGAAAGVVYACGERHVALRPLVKGTGYGLIVWAGSYLGLIPALGIVRPVTQQPTRRNMLMIVAHLVWGSAVGIAVDGLREHGPHEHPSFLGAN